MKLIALNLLLFVLCTPASSAAPVCFFGSVPCFLACGNPPRLTRPDQAALWLRDKQYGELNWVDRSTALVTTQFGKCLGINGWKRYRFQVWAVGTVDQAATSWDGLRTVDIVLEDFNGYTSDKLLPRPRYIRAEIIRHVWKRLDHPPCRGDYIRVEGELHWDGHGFLEIHPSRDRNVQYLPNPP